MGQKRVGKLGCNLAQRLSTISETDRVYGNGNSHQGSSDEDCV